MKQERSRRNEKGKFLQTLCNVTPHMRKMTAWKDTVSPQVEERGKMKGFAKRQ